MASASAGDGYIGGATVIEVNEPVAADDEIMPLLADAASNSSNSSNSRDRLNPKMTIFSVSYSRKRPSKEISSVGAAETEADVLNQMVNWVWSGSRYSGLLCVALSSIIYFIMEILNVLFPVRSIPIFQTLLTRCVIIVLLSILCLQRSGQPLFVSTHVRNLLISRSLTGLISVLSFIYSVRNLPLSLATTLNFATPVMASLGSKIILQEKLAVSYDGGIACSFIGIMLIFLPMLIIPGDSSAAGDMSVPSSIPGNNHILAILVGIVSLTFGGISCCLVRAGAKAADHPVYTVFAFGLIATPLSAICNFIFQEFVLPTLFTFCLMVIHGVLAFFAEICLARGLQIEQVSKATNMLYMKVLLSQIWSMIFMGVGASFGKLIGCLLILASVCSTVYLGPEKEIE